MKIILTGPVGSGKTTIGNFLSGSKDSLAPPGKYNPTVGVRILEIEEKLDNFSQPVNVELWDCSGDHSFESCWKAIMHQSDGVILVYNPDAAGQDQQLSDWFDFFVRKNGLKEEQCMIFAFRSNSNASGERFRPPPLFSRVTAALLTDQSGPDVRNMFDNFVKDLYGIKQRSEMQKK